jgi:DNA invertase Pin-like site-specific DNA recombinase
LKTVIYLRTSTQEQNPLNQLRDCKTLVSGDYEVVEEKQSAFKDKDRPLFEQVKKQIQHRKINELICWDLDRLYRNRKKLIEFFQFCKIYNCKINSFRQQWLNKFSEIPEPFNEIMFDMMLQIMGWLAEEESKKKSERVKIAYKNSNKKWGRKPLENVEARVIELYNQGKSLREIASEVYYWDKNRNKRFVSKSAVHKIIKNFKGGFS